MGSKRSFGQLRKLPSGRWQAGYTGPDAAVHRAPSTFTAKIDAEGWLASERRLIESGEWGSPGTRRASKRGRSRTLAEYSEWWLADRTLKPRTREHYASLLERQIVPGLGSLPLAGVTTPIVREWYADLGTATPTLRAHAYGLLRTILGTALEDQVIPANPCHIRGAGATKRVHRIRPATLDELTALAAAMPPRYRLMVLLAAWCALRFGELTELRRRDIDQTNGIIRVRRGVTRVGSALVVGTPKSDAGVRDVVIPPHLLPMLRAHVIEHADPGPDGLLFPAPHGGHLRQSSLQKPYYHARKAAGRPDLRFHDLRHTGAVLAAATGATLAELMARLGHSTTGAAMRYQHAAQDRDRVIAEALSRMATA